MLFKRAGLWFDLWTVWKVYFCLGILIQLFLPYVFQITFPIFITLNLIMWRLKLLGLITEDNMVVNFTVSLKYVLFSVNFCLILIALEKLCIMKKIELEKKATCNVGVNCWEMSMTFFVVVTQFCWITLSSVPTVPSALTESGDLDARDISVSTANS